MQAAQTAATPSPTPTSPDVAVLDKLISVFATKTPKEWRKLIAHSKQWPLLAGGVLQRSLCSAGIVTETHNMCASIKSTAKQDLTRCLCVQVAAEV